MKGEIMLLPISSIRLDGRTQPRTAINQDTVDSYETSMRVGDIFPPVDVFFDGTDYWLADGFHRMPARARTGADQIECTVHAGTVEEARWFSYAANKTNGLHRSNADKQRAVQSALEHSTSKTLSDREIGRHVGVHHSTVEAVRKKLSGEVSQIEPRTVTRNGTTYMQNTANIGTRPKVKSARAAAKVPAVSQKTPVAATLPKLSRGRVSKVTLGEATKVVRAKKPAANRKPRKFDMAKEVDRVMKLIENRAVKCPKDVRTKWWKSLRAKGDAQYARRNSVAPKTVGAAATHGTGDPAEPIRGDTELQLNLWN